MSEPKPPIHVPPTEVVLSPPKSPPRSEWSEEKLREDAEASAYLSLLINYPECVEAMRARRLEPQASEMIKAHLLEMIKPPSLQ
jgi:hypothetical protein